MSILQILETIGADTKRTYKLAVVEQHKNDELFLKVLKLALDPYINFYIRAIPKYESTGTKTLEWALVELEKLSSRQFTGHAGIEHLRSILNNLSTDDAVVIERIIGKDLRMGCSEGTVNTVIAGFIPTYPCLLARPYDAKNIKNIVYPAYSDLKADGLRVNFVVDGDKVSICGRSGRAIDLLGQMDEEFVTLGKQFDVPSVFDGELVVVDENGVVLSRKVGNGIINKAIKGTITIEEARMVRAQLWDVIPFSEFKQGKSTKIYKDRFESLEKAVIACTPQGEDALAAKLKGIPAKFWVIPYQIVNNLEEAVAHFELLLSQGHEGTILKNFSALWEDTRSKHLVKMKAEKTCDLEIIGYNPGEGKFLGQVGSIICASSDRKVEVSISGFTDALRLEVTRRQDELRGTIVEVLYNERISSQSANRNGVDSLFLPRFNEFRTDKFIADSTNEIK